MAFGGTGAARRESAVVVRAVVQALQGVSVSEEESRAYGAEEPPGAPPPPETLTRQRSSVKLLILRLKWLTLCTQNPPE